MGGASAYIESNLLSCNVRANLALGGKNSLNTYVLYNTIADSAQEGIFIDKADACTIYGNLIQANVQGIIMFDASPLIQANTIIR